MAERGTLSELATAARRQGDLERAAALYRQSLALCRGHSDRNGATYTAGVCLAGLAELAAASAAPPRAERLLGAAEGLRATLDYPPAEYHLAMRFERNVADARVALPVHEETAAAYLEGIAMTLEEAIAYALDPTACQPSYVAGATPAALSDRNGEPTPSHQ
jgi:hypothetical protein